MTLHKVLLGVIACGLLACGTFGCGSRDDETIRQAQDAVRKAIETQSGGRIRLIGFGKCEFNDMGAGTKVNPDTQVLGMCDVATKIEFTTDCAWPGGRHSSFSVAEVHAVGATESSSVKEFRELADRTRAEGGKMVAAMQKGRQTTVHVFVSFWKQGADGEWRIERDNGSPFFDVPYDSNAE
jgi:hypothetical protein